jgi:hypothetical protein
LTALLENLDDLRRSTVQKSGYLALLALLSVMLGACQREEGPAEKAGKEIDKAVKEAGQAMERAADSIKDAVKKDSK